MAGLLWKDDLSGKSAVQIGNRQSAGCVCTDNNIDNDDDGGGGDEGLPDVSFGQLASSRQHRLHLESEETPAAKTNKRQSKQTNKPLTVPFHCRFTSGGRLGQESGGCMDAAGPL